MSTARENGQAPVGALPGRIGQPARAERDTHPQNSYRRPLGATPSLDALRTAEGVCSTCHEWSGHMPDCPDDPMLAEQAERPRYRIVALKRPVGWVYMLDDRETGKVYAVIANDGVVHCADCRRDECAHTRFVRECGL